MPSLVTGFCLLALCYFSLLSESLPQGRANSLTDYDRHSRDVPPSSYAYSGGKSGGGQGGVSPGGYAGGAGGYAGGAGGYGAAGGTISDGSSEGGSDGYDGGPESSFGYSAPQTFTQQSAEDDYNGNFNYSFLANNGISVTLSGRPKILATGEVVQTMKGEYSYTAPDGTPIVTRWYADDTGFHAEGRHIPGST